MTIERAIAVRIHTTALIYLANEDVQHILLASGGKEELMRLAHRMGLNSENELNHTQLGLALEQIITGIIPDENDPSGFKNIGPIGLAQIVKRRIRPYVDYLSQWSSKYIREFSAMHIMGIQSRLEFHLRKGDPEGQGYEDTLKMAWALMSDKRSAVNNMAIYLLHNDSRYEREKLQNRIGPRNYLLNLVQIYVDYLQDMAQLNSEINSLLHANEAKAKAFFGEYLGGIQEIKIMTIAQDLEQVREILHKPYAEYSEEYDDAINRFTRSIATLKESSSGYILALYLLSTDKDMLKAFEIKLGRAAAEAERKATSLTIQITGLNQQYLALTADNARLTERLSSQAPEMQRQLEALKAQSNVHGRRAAALGLRLQEARTEKEELRTKYVTELKARTTLEREQLKLRARIAYLEAVAARGTKPDLSPYKALRVLFVGGPQDTPYVLQQLIEAHQLPQDSFRWHDGKKSIKHIAGLVRGLPEGKSLVIGLPSSNGHAGTNKARRSAERRGTPYKVYGEKTVNYLAYFLEQYAQRNITSK